MGGRPFDPASQRAFQDLMVQAGLVESASADKPDYASGARKFASCFKQLGFITDWSGGRPWTLTPVGQRLLAHPELEETVFLRQLLTYQLPSPIERGSRLTGYTLRPFRVLLRFLAMAADHGLVGLTKEEIGLFVITTLTEDRAALTRAMDEIVGFRTRVEAERGLVARRRVAAERLIAIASRIGLKPGTLTDYADSNSRYAMMSGLLTSRGIRLALLDARRPLIDLLLDDGTTLLGDADYLPRLYDPDWPVLPTDDIIFLNQEIRRLETDVSRLVGRLAMTVDLPAPPADRTIPALQVYERCLRQARLVLREQAFADDHHHYRPDVHLDEIAELLERVASRRGGLIGGTDYYPALLEWAIWRLFLVIDHLTGPIHTTHGFRLDEDLNPVHHAPGGAADLRLVYDGFVVLAEMTLTRGSRQFAAEGEPVTRHVYQAIRDLGDTARPVFGLFIAPEIDPNTVHLFHQARYWADWQSAVPTPVVVLTITDIKELIAWLKKVRITPSDLRRLFEEITDLQQEHPHGPAWHQAASQTYRAWLAGLGEPSVQSSAPN